MGAEVEDVRFDGRDQGAYELTFDDCSGASLDHFPTSSSPTAPRSRAVPAPGGSNPFGGQIGATGVWVSADGGANWRQRNDELPMLRVGGIDVRPDGAEVAVYSRGVYTTTMDELFASQDSP